MATEQEVDRKVYKHPVLYLRKSKAGEHLYAFNVDVRDTEGEPTGEAVLGSKVESLIANIGEVKKVIDGSMDWCKISVMAAEEAGE